MQYEDWVSSKSKTVENIGIKIPHEELSACLYPHQKDLARWALAKGRAAIFADTGLGKTAMQLEWARHVSAHGRVLILAPLAVASQTVDEGQSLGLANVKYLRSDNADQRIVITNYEMMENFDPSNFVGVVLDESSILKSFTGRTRTQIIEAFKETPYRLAATATPAPNDFTELGNHSEFLGIKTRTEMLAEYFVHDMENTQDWRLKGHAIKSFWRWLASWGAVVRTPSDLGYDDDRYNLPHLRMHEVVIPTDHTDAYKAGMLFSMNASSLSEQRALRKSTLDKRVEEARKIASTGGPCIIWCETNDESAALKTIDGAVEVKGSQTPEEKSDLLTSFSKGESRVMVTKPSIAGFGLNWQQCSRMVFVGASHSYEQTYQAIRRCWRFGQKNPVDVYVIRAETEQLIVDNYRRKEADAIRLGMEMSAQVGDSVRSEVRGANVREWNPYNAHTEMITPAWVNSEET